MLPDDDKWIMVADPEFVATPAERATAFTALDHAHHQVIAAEVAELIAILHAAEVWDVNSEAVDAAIERDTHGEKLTAYGHDGTPHLGEYLALEIGPLLGITARSAISRIGEALDLGYRFPLTLQKVMAGNIRVWQAKKACARCHHLPLEAAHRVDEQLAHALRLLPFTLAMKRMDEWIIAADPQLAQQRHEAARKARFIRVSPIEDGHVTIYGVVDARDGILFDSILKQVAALIPADPDCDSFDDHDRRRAQALGIVCRTHQEVNTRADGQAGQATASSVSDACRRAESHQLDNHDSTSIGKTDDTSRLPVPAASWPQQTPDQQDRKAREMSYDRETQGSCAQTSRRTTMPTHTLIVHINADNLAFATPAAGPSSIDDKGDHNSGDSASTVNRQSGDDEPHGAAHDPAAGAGNAEPAGCESARNPTENQRRITCYQPQLPPTGIARIEDWGPILVSQLPEFLKDSAVVVRPVINPTDIKPTNAYQVPEKMRFVIEQRNPVDVFPYGTTASRYCDQDHTMPFHRGENQPTGQTNPANLGPLSRKAHRAKTNGGWQLQQPSPGTFIWTSKLGYCYQVSPGGTTRIHVPARRGL